MWALQEEFEAEQNKLFFQVLPNNSNQAGLSMTFYFDESEKYRMGL